MGLAIVAAIFLVMDMITGGNFNDNLRFALIAILVISATAHVAVRLTLKHWLSGRFTDAQDPMRD